MTTLILFYGGLWMAVWMVFKLSRRSTNPSGNIFFWTTLVLASSGLTVFLFYWFTRNFFGAPPEDGWNRRFDENGKIETEFFASDGEIEGDYKSYYPNGQLEYLSKYADGVQTDTSIAYYENGQVSNLRVFKDDKIIFEASYTPNGLKKSERFNPTDTLQENYNITYYSNGQKDFETRISNRSFEGKGFYYYRNGHVKYQGYYKNGRKDGVWLYLDSLTGNLLDKDTFNYLENRKFKKSW
jgi:antitoxin component YwqK of YwqJK toxin-antitoxin module